MEDSTEAKPHTRPLTDEVDTRRFVRSAFTLLKASRCMDKDCRIRRKPKRAAQLIPVPEILRSVPVQGVKGAESSIRISEDREEGSVSVSSEAPSLPQPDASHKVAIPSSSFGSMASKTLIKIYRRPGEEERRWREPSTVLAERPLPLVKERISSLVDPAQSYFAKWERMKDKRDARELALIRRNVRHELIRDVSLAAFLEGKSNLNRDLRHLKESFSAEKKLRYQKSKQWELATLHNIAKTRENSIIEKTSHANSLRERVRSVGRMHRLMHLQESEEAMMLGASSRVRLNDFTSTIVSPPKALTDRLQHSNRWIWFLMLKSIFIIFASPNEKRLNMEVIRHYETGVRSKRIKQYSQYRSLLAIAGGKTGKSQAISPNSVSYF